MKLDPGTKNIFKFILKLIVSALGLWAVSSKIDYQQAREIITHSRPGWLLLSLLSFNLSQWVSTYRLGGFLHAEGAPIGYWDNLRLYYQGMFYNLFLPGGIGGDGYKVFALNNNFKTPVKFLIRALLFDRGSGLVFLIVLVMALGPFSSAVHTYRWIWGASLAGIVGAILAFYLLFYWFVKIYLARFWSICFRAAIVQVLQVVAALFIFLALGVDKNLVDYLVLFQISSIAIILPVTIGGVGAREMVFFYGPQFLQVDGNLGVVFSLLFFLVLALSSLGGMFVQYSPQAESFTAVERA